MNFTFSDNEKLLFQSMGSILAQENQRMQGSLNSQKDFACELAHFKQKLSTLGYFNDFKDSPPIGAAAILEMMRIFAKFHPSLFLGVEYGFRIFAQLYQWMTESFMQSLEIDTMPCAIAFCEDFIETDLKTPSISVQSVDTHYLLSGEKQFVINAGFSKWLAINGQMDGKDTIFFLSPQTEGLEILPLKNKRIFPELVLANIQFRNCPVLKKMVLQPEQMTAMISQIQVFENFASIACALGMIDQCIEITTAFAKTHFSENKPMIAHQAVAFSLAETVTLKQTAELLAYRAAWMFSTDHSEKFLMNQCAKVFCTEAAETIASQCMTILGGQVFVENHMIEQTLHNSKFIQIAGTSTHLARMTIADVVLK